MLIWSCKGLTSSCSFIPQNKRLYDAVRLVSLISLVSDLYYLSNIMATTFLIFYYPSSSDQIFSSTPKCRPLPYFSISAEFCCQWPPWSPDLTLHFDLKETSNVLRDIVSLG